MLKLVLECVNVQVYPGTFIVRWTPQTPHAPLCKVANSCMHGTQRRHRGVHVSGSCGQQAARPCLSRFQEGKRSCAGPCFAKSTVHTSLNREVMMHITAPQRAKL